MCPNCMQGLARHAFNIVMFALLHTLPERLTTSPPSILYFNRIIVLFQRIQSQGTDVVIEILRVQDESQRTDVVGAILKTLLDKTVGRSNSLVASHAGPQGQVNAGYITLVTCPVIAESRNPKPQPFSPSLPTSYPHSCKACPENARSTPEIQTSRDGTSVSQGLSDNLTFF